VVIWLFSGGRGSSHTAERRAQQMIAASYALLVAYISVEAVRDLVGYMNSIPLQIGEIGTYDRVSAPHGLTRAFRASWRNTPRWDGTASTASRTTAIL
jgi:hypothetical protein